MKQILLFLLILLTLPVFGQYMDEEDFYAEKKQNKSKPGDIRFGGKFGFGLATVVGDDAGSDAIKYSFSYSVGGMLDYIIDEKFVLTIEALYSGKGPKYKIESTQFYEGGESFLDLYYIEIPVLFGLKLKEDSYRVYGGVYFGYLVNAKDVDFDGNKTDVTDDMNEMDYGIIFGTSLIKGSFILDFRFSRGFSGIYPTESIDVYNQSFTLSGGVLF